MQVVITLIPVFFSIFAGLAVSWGLANFYGLCLYVWKCHIRQVRMRMSDPINAGFIFLVTLLNLYFMFLNPGLALYFMDALLIGNIWFTVYLLYITRIQLSGWPELSCVGSVRSRPTKILETD